MLPVLPACIARAQTRLVVIMDSQSDDVLLGQACSWGSDSDVRRAHSQLAVLIQAGLPRKPPKVSKLLALALRRDAWALLQSKPDFGVSAVPDELGSFRAFDAMLVDCIRDVLRRTHQQTQGLPLSGTAGPWEGGLVVESVPSTAVTGSCRLKIAAWNAQGAFGRSLDVDKNQTRMLHFAAHLLHVGAAVAVISEPRLSPQACWPDCTCYSFHGTQTQDPASVAVLIHDAVSDAVSILSGYGDQNAMWISCAGEPQLLLLAVYGPHTGHETFARKEFWNRRHRELVSIRSQVAFRHCKFMLMGDTNLHFPDLGHTNARLARPFDHEMLLFWQSAAGFNVTIRNEPFVATHASGSVIDLVAAEPSLGLDMGVTWLQDETLRSDHAFVSCEFLAVNISLTGTSKCSQARWEKGASWEDVTARIDNALKFIAGWAARLLLNQVVKAWVAAGRFKGLRRNLLDRVVWWRSVVLCLAGHYGGLVSLCRKRDTKDPVQELWPFFASEPSSDQDELLEQLKASVHEAKVATFSRLSTSNPQAAQSFLSQLLKPQGSLQTAFREESTGRRMSDYETLQHIAGDVAHRADEARRGDPAFNALIKEYVGKARAEALAETADAPSCQIGFARFGVLFEGIITAKATAQLPRLATVSKNFVGRLLSWIIVNLLFALCLLPSSWYRVISPIRKRGPKVVDDPSNLRPISYVSDLEGVLDLVWLDLCRQRLISYAGMEQVGGQMDPVLVAIGLLASLQTRNHAGLPSYLLKADLHQGYDLAWRDAVRFHAWEANIRGNSWLVLDCSLAADRARVRLGPLLGPFFVLINHGIRQGGRSAVQLFGAFAKGLTDAVKQGNVGVGIGHSVAACRAVLQDRAGSLSPYAAPGWEDITLAASDFDPMAPTQAIRNLLPPSVPREDALLFLDVVAQWHLLILQFIDDAFVLQSTCRGLLGVCNTMSAFAQFWRHRFASGSKGAAVLCVRDKWPDSLPPPLLDGQPVRIVDQIEILGMSFDEKLSFDGALQKLGSQMCEAASNLRRALDAQGLGLAWHVQQFPSRVEAAALFGCELLVSHFLGWPQVSRKLNSYHYKAIKALLGMTNFSLGDGGYVQLLTWMGGSWRLSAKVSLRIVTTLARLLTMPPSTFPYALVRAVAGIPGETWVEAARVLALELGIQQIPSWESLPQGVLTKEDIRGHIRRWKSQVVIPAIQQQEFEWKQRACSKIGWEPPPLLHRSLVMTRNMFWTPRLGRACRAWFFALLTGTLVTGGWQRGDQLNGATRGCGLCGCDAASLTLHLSMECPAARQMGAALGVPASSLFEPDTSEQGLKAKVSLLAEILVGLREAQNRIL